MIRFSQEGPGRALLGRGRPEVWIPSGKAGAFGGFVTWEGACLLLSGLKSQQLWVERPVTYARVCSLPDGEAAWVTSREGGAVCACDFSSLNRVTHSCIPQRNAELNGGRNTGSESPWGEETGSTKVWRILSMPVILSEGWAARPERIAAPGSGSLLSCKALSALAQESIKPGNVARPAWRLEDILFGAPAARSGARAPCMPTTSAGSPALLPALCPRGHGLVQKQ